MKWIATIALSLLLFSCIKKDRDMDQMNQRITRLEQKIDSLMSGRNINSIGINNMNNSGMNPYNISLQFSRCQAITKKGTQCKRKAKANNYCWQHGG